MNEEMDKNLKQVENSLNLLRQQATPPLDLDFTQKVMGRLHPGSFWWRIFGRKYLPLKIAMGTALAAGLVVVLYFSPYGQHRPELATIQERAQEEAASQKIYQVRFSLQRPEAGEVKILGDFTQWNALVLAKDGQGNFTAELTLPEGTYAYGFVVDGKEWVPDQTAHGFVPDGFGRVNSILNL